MHLIAFVDDILSDIITPALDPRFQIKRVTLFCEDDNHHETDHVAAVARRAGLEVITQPIQPDWDMDAVREHLTSAINKSPSRSLINLSAATPLQAAVAQEVALIRQIPAFVIHPEKDTLIWLTPVPEEHPAEDTDINNSLSLEHYFGLFGHEVSQYQYRLNSRDADLEELAGQMALLALSSPNSIHEINWASSEMDENYVSLRRVTNNHKLKEFINRSGIAALKPDGRIDFRNATSRVFLGGGWLEIWLLAEAAALKSEFQIHDAACGIKITAHEGVSNEYDLAMLVNNQLYLVECKTVSTQKKSGVGQDVIFKLDSVSQLGGLDAHAMLVTLNSPTPNEQTRADLQELEIINGKQLLKIRQRLRDWIRATS